MAGAAEGLNPYLGSSEMSSIKQPEFGPDKEIQNLSVARSSNGSSAYVLLEVMPAGA